MKKPGLPILLLFITIITGGSTVLSQSCSVESESLKGSYTGECKKGKANGQGKAVGTDTYEGEFKSGVPHGEGTYTWSNGNSYHGKFEKGLKQGYGTMTVKRPGQADSTIEGYWKKDEYTGRYEYPYKVLTKTKRVTRVDIKPATTAADNERQVAIRISSTSAGAGTLSNAGGGLIPRVEISNLILQAGNYVRAYSNNTSPAKSETILFEVSFPIKMRIDMPGGESVELVINEAGSYIVEINLNQ